MGMCSRNHQIYDEMCKDTHLEKMKTMKENRLSEFIKTALKGPW